MCSKPVIWKGGGSTDVDIAPVPALNKKSHDDDDDNDDDIGGSIAGVNLYGVFSFSSSL